MTDGITEASEELEKYEKLIKQLEGQQKSAQVFLNMKHFTFHTDPKVTRYAIYFKGLRKIANRQDVGEGGGGRGEKGNL